MIVLSLVVAVVAQFVLSRNQRSLLGERGGNQITQPPHWHWSLLPAYFQRVVGGVVTGQRFTGYLWVHAGNAFLGALIAVFVVLIALSVLGTDLRTRVLVLVTLATSMAMFLFAGYQRQVGSQFLWPHGSSNTISSHYVVAPTLLLLSALLIRLDAGTRSIPVGVQKGVRIGVVLLVLLAALASFKVDDAALRGQPRWSVQVAAGRTECRRTQLDGVSLVIDPTVDSPPMAVSCTKLLGEALPGRHPPPPDLRTAILKPSNGAILSKGAVIVVEAMANDMVSKVELRLTKAGGRSELLGVAGLTPVGYLLYWNVAKVTEGIYTLQSVAHDAAGTTSRSPAVTVTVKH